MYRCGFKVHLKHKMGVSALLIHQIMSLYFYSPDVLFVFPRTVFPEPQESSAVTCTPGVGCAMLAANASRQQPLTHATLAAPSVAARDFLQLFSHVQYSSPRTMTRL